jgi:putative nucleotidyltransferase with HDIG domain
MVNASGTSMYRHVHIDDVTVGMYIEDVFEKDGMLLVSEGRTIENPRQVEELRKRGVRKVRINVKRSVLRRGVPEFEEIINDHQREEEYYKELETAVEVHKEGVIRVTEVLNAIREGNPFSLSIIRSAAGDIVESLSRNQDAIVSLSQLKDFDNYTYVHSVNVAILMASLARTMGYDEERLVELCMGGLLHDVGKMKVPEKILNKPGKLTDTEFAIVKRHPEFGIEAILGHRGISDMTRKVVLQHHERYNGKGYPLGLKGERIHEVGLISAVADVYDALTSDRVYKTAWTPQKALALIFRGCDDDYSRRIVELFTKHMGIFPVGSFVKLASGEMGVVIRIDQGQLLHPVVLVLFDKNGRRLTTSMKVNLWEKKEHGQAHLYKIEQSLNPKAFNIITGDFIQHRF